MVSSNLPDRAQRSRWPYLSLIPVGLGAWAPIYAGSRARRPLWLGLGLLWSVLVIIGLVLASGKNGGSNDLAGAFLIVGWVGSIATSFAIRDAYDERVQSELSAAQAAGERRLRDRARAQRLVQTNPALAREIGIGRPDEPGAVPAGLVDVNNASVTALLTVPGVDGELATRIVETRDRVDGFASLEDMGETLDLDGDLVERLRGAVVFLPRT